MPRRLTGDIAITASFALEHTRDVISQKQESPLDVCGEGRGVASGDLTQLGPSVGPGAVSMVTLVLQVTGGMEDER
ncbi:unnamed protein product [Boreogadus saida]